MFLFTYVTSLWGSPSNILLAPYHARFTTKKLRPWQMSSCTINFSWLIDPRTKPIKFHNLHEFFFKIACLQIDFKTWQNFLMHDDILKSTSSQQVGWQYQEQASGSVCSRMMKRIGACTGKVRNTLFEGISHPILATLLDSIWYRKLQPHPPDSDTPYHCCKASQVALDMQRWIYDNKLKRRLYLNPNNYHRISWKSMRTYDRRIYNIQASWASPA